MQSRKSFLLRLSPALYEQLEAWARQEMRSTNGQIEFLLKELVNRRKRSVNWAQEKRFPGEDSGLPTGPPSS